jgi:hypothetical protein
LCHSLQYNSLLQPPQPQQPPQQQWREIECSTSSTSQQGWQKPHCLNHKLPPPSWQHEPQQALPHAQASPHPPLQPPRSWQQLPRQRPSGSTQRQLGGPQHSPQPCHRVPANCRPSTWRRAPQPQPGSQPQSQGASQAQSTLQPHAQPGSQAQPPSQPQLHACRVPQKISRKP